MRFDLAINLMTLNGVAKKKIFIMGGGKQWRPFLHVRDAAAVFAQVLEEPLSKVGGQVFNVGADEANYQIADLAKMVAEELGDVELEWAPDDADKRTYRVSFDRFHQALGMKLKHDAHFGIREIAGALKDGTIPDPEEDHHYNIRTMKTVVAMPVREGGEPVRKTFLPFALPLIGEEEEREVLETLRSGWVTTGPRTKRFEERFAAFAGSKHCVAVNSCTSALHLCLKVLDIGPGDEVVTTPLTFVSTVNVIEHVGAKPVFADVDPDTLNIDVRKLAKSITKRTKAVIPVHLAGYPCDMKEILALARRRGLKVIEDAAHAAGSSYRGRPVGSWSDFTCFSFYPIKNLTTIEGGAVTTSQDRYVDRLRRLSLHGMDRDAWKRYSAAGSPHWYVTEPGYKYNMTDIQAAVGLHQLDRSEDFNRRRAQIVQAYDEAFRGLPGFLRPDYGASDRMGNNHLYIVVLDTSRLRIDRDGMLDALKQEGIGTGIHFLPVHFHPFYRKKYGLKDRDLPLASDRGRRILSLPLYPKMSDPDVQDVIRAFQKVLTFYRKG
jgi:dTDP-4-amino-4,6-dideoxygalactose transaminase